MNINEPSTSRQLAALIQGVKGGHREQFIEDAKKAKDMKSFIKHFLKSYE
jgi:endo-1,4-beta-mannosidase